MISSTCLLITRLNTTHCFCLTWQEFALCLFLLSIDDKTRNILRFQNISGLIEQQLSDVCASKRLPTVNKPALAMRIWIQSSVIAVVTLFCTFVSLASLLVDEFHKRTKKSSFLNNKKHGNTKKSSLELDKWLHQFHILNLFIENIRDFFEPILVLTIFRKMVQFTEYFRRIVNFLTYPRNTWLKLFFTVLNQDGIGPSMLIDSLSLIAIVIVSAKLQTKV